MTAAIHKEVRTAGVLFLTGDGKIVMQRRDSGAPTSPNRLGFFGGHMNRGEEPIDTIIREVHEETSVPTHEIEYRFIDIIKVPPAPGHNVANPFYVFTAQIKDWHYKVFEGKG